jgi:hypothetical protein
MYFDNTNKIVMDKVQEVLNRPEDLKELSDVIEASVREELDGEVKRRTKDYVRGYDSGLKELAKKGIDAWIESHLDVVNALIDKAAERAATDETIYQEVAKHQFQHFLTKTANEAVFKAMTRQTRKVAAKKPAKR